MDLALIYMSKAKPMSHRVRKASLLIILLLLKVPMQICDVT